MHHSRLSMRAVTCLMTLIFGMAALAQGGHQHSTAPKNKAKKAADATIICPILGKKVLKSKAIQVAYKDKIYYVCCKSCVDPFKQNPEKYIKKAVRYADPIKPKGQMSSGSAGHSESCGHMGPSGQCSCNPCGCLS